MMRIQDKTMTTENRLEELSNLIIQLNDNMNNNFDVLYRKVQQLENQSAEIDNLNAKIGSFSGSLETMERKSNKKLKVILDEVLKENQRIIKRIRMLESEIYDGTPRPADDRADESSFTPSGDTEYVEHIVKSGENLWSIANNYGVTMESIAEANNMESISDIIKPGQRLNIPVEK